MDIVIENSDYDSARRSRTPSEIEMLELPASSEIVDRKTVIVMIGLPATGKSYISKMLDRYLNWRGYKTQVFNAGDYRRKFGYTGESSNFFDPGNKGTVSLKNKFAMLALDDLITFLRKGGDVALFDATNSNIDRRKHISERCAHAGFNVLFLESICDDPDLIRKNCEMKLNSPDYKNRDREESLRDFRLRLEHYKKGYEPLDKTRDGRAAYIKLYNVGEYVIANRCNGVLESQVVSYLLNTHLTPRKIWLCLHGETDNTKKGILGGDPPINASGISFSRKLYTFIHEQKIDNITIMCDTSRRVYQTVKPLIDEYNVVFCNLLRELDGGDYDNMTYEEIEQKFPDEYKRRQQNKLTYRYPGGESYIDVKERLSQILLKLIGSRDNILIVGHVAVIRIILAYFVNAPLSEVFDKEVEMNTIYELEPTAYCTNANQFTL